VRGKPPVFALALIFPGLSVACSSGAGEQRAPGATEADAGSAVSLVGPPPADVPVAGVSAEWVSEFNRGDALFDVIARQADGLGPLFTRQACASCHEGALRGPGFVQKFALVLGDAITPAPDQSALAYGHTSHPFLAAGATTPIAPPNDPSVRVTMRLGPPVLGRGYLEAILDSEIVRVADAQAAAGGAIRGKVNYVTYASEANPDQRFHQYVKGDTVIGRFGLKARVATLDDFTADALAFDMGLTSPLRPEEFPNPDRIADDAKPGIDISLDGVNQRADYTRLLAIPPRARPSGNGAELFEQAQCSHCHVPALRTRADYPIPELAGIDAPVFTDLLLHDMGDALSDSLSGGDGVAGPRDWRTAPLIGLSYFTTYLHDGRAATIRDAILMHDGNGSEAHDSVALFQTLAAPEQDALVQYVGAL
jgi:CxxC motif-containing protein (DUF1111 family)